MMELLCSEVFPDPSAGDPLAGAVGKMRKAKLREIALEVCEFLQSGDGLSAVPAIPKSRLDPELLFRVDEAVALERTGLHGITEVWVAAASNGIAMTTVSVEDYMAPVPLHPLISVCFEPVQEWPNGASEMPFFLRLAAILRSDKLIFGYGMDMPDDS